AARARRMAMIRRRVIVGTLATFVLAWGVIAFDGSMGTTTSASTLGGTTSSASDGTASSSSDLGSASSGDSPAAVTTAQS
ncbi:MAG TPA: hypothetical protein VK631_01395, partial [Solirubrobacteraceae bacterium]|nr:hypothetical protein [Solirubrobacteraceae bacterium]